MKKIQSDWKKIGHVPRKFSDDIWKRFKATCNYYFNRFHQQKNAVSKDQQQVVDRKQEYLESLKNKKKFKKEEVFDMMNEWQDLGRLPKNSKHLDSKFNKLIDATLDNLSLDKNEIVFLKFKNLVDSYLENNDYKKLDSEQLFVRKKIDEIVREIQQLENNLSFFSISNKNNPLVLNVKNQVNEFKEELVVWKEKLNYIKKLDY
jgi:cell division protein FtsB